MSFSIFLLLLFFLFCGHLNKIKLFEIKVVKKFSPSQLEAEKLASSDKKTQVLSKGKVFRAERKKHFIIYNIYMFY